MKCASPLQVALHVQCVVVDTIGLLCVLMENLPPGIDWLAEHFLMQLLHHIDELAIGADDGARPVLWGVVADFE